ncbi:hypothetical protein CMI41_04915 [Candidatus Pacearchaeota archaeon]|nr:hypothetical protein [Candidatus Pacearchaeota archaeon]|tara:strand:+ start:3534 stop:3773 length:240 start_codon:yes stop_codon:yes gene_type:complete
MNLVIVDDQGNLHLVTDNIETMDIEPEDWKDETGWSNFLSSSDVIDDIQNTLKQIEIQHIAKTSESHSKRVKNESNGKV